MNKNVELGNNRIRKILPLKDFNFGYFHPQSNVMQTKEQIRMLYLSYE